MDFRGCDPDIFIVLCDPDFHGFSWVSFRFSSVLWLVVGAWIVRGCHSDFRRCVGGVCVLVVGCVLVVCCVGCVCLAGCLAGCCVFCWVFVLLCFVFCCALLGALLGVLLGVLLCVLLLCFAVFCSC